MTRSIKLTKFKGDGAGKFSDTIITEVAYKNLIEEKDNFESWLKAGPKRSNDEIEKRKPILDDFKIVCWGNQDDKGNFIPDAEVKETESKKGKSNTEQNG